MSPELRYSARWVPPWFAAGFFVVFLPFAWAAWVILLTPPPHPDAIRILVPVALPMLYLLLQLIFNHRHVHVTPTEVCVTHGPFPGGNSLTLQRADIRLCYARKVLGLQVAGVESHRALLVDVASPMLTLMDSRAAAYRIRTVLNAHPSAPALDVGPSTPPLGATWAWRVVVYIWTAVFLAALLLGVFWQLSQEFPHHPATYLLLLACNTRRVRVYPNRIRVSLRTRVILAACGRSLTHPHPLLGTHP